MSPWKPLRRSIFFVVTAADPVIQRAFANRVSNAATRVPSGIARSASHSRTPMPRETIGLCWAADSRDCGRLRPCAWVGAPTTIRWTPGAGRGGAEDTSTISTGVTDRSPSATASAMARVLPYMDS
jgi:hypothetical protein